MQPPITTRPMIHIRDMTFSYEFVVQPLSIFRLECPFTQG
jgi:hypothetical protein